MPLYHAGQIDIYYGRWENAERRLQKAIAGYFSPLTLAEEEVFHDYGMALWHMKKPAESIYNLQASIITNPKFSKAYSNLACAQTLHGMDMGDEKIVNQGLTSLEQAITLAPDMALYWRNAASLLKLIGDGAASENAWQKFNEMDPTSQGEAIPDNCVWEFYFR
jgi:tetratricopeptide (TPR) repeat protein